MGPSYHQRYELWSPGSFHNKSHRMCKNPSPVPHDLSPSCIQTHIAKAWIDRPVPRYIFHHISGILCFGYLFFLVRKDKTAQHARKLECPCDFERRIRWHGQLVLHLSDRYNQNKDIDQLLYQLKNRNETVQNL